MTLLMSTENIFIFGEEKLSQNYHQVLLKKDS